MGKGFLSDASATFLVDQFHVSLALETSKTLHLNTSKKYFKYHLSNVNIANTSTLNKPTPVWVSRYVRVTLTYGCAARGFQ